MDTIKRLFSAFDCNKVKNKSSEGEERDEKTIGKNVSCIVLDNGTFTSY